MRTSDGAEINGPNVFGYNIDVPRFPDSRLPTGSQHRLPIRGIRYIGVSADGTVCRFGARPSVVSDDSTSDSSSASLLNAGASSAAEHVRRAALEVDEPSPIAPAPLWAKTISLIMLLALMCGVIIAMALSFSQLTSVYAEIYSVAVAGILLFFLFVPTID
jgi:hypothetical protein